MALNGGKQYLASRIVALMPPRRLKPNAPEANDPGWLHYVEPYLGGGAVLLANDPEGISEVANDLNEDLINFWDVLRVWAYFIQFKQMCEATTFSQPVYRQAADRLNRAKVPAASQDWAEDRIERAWAFFVACRQSLSGRMKGFAAITRNRTRRGMNEQASAWIGAVDGLPAVHARLRRVLVLNQPALDVIQKEDGPRTLFYLDPPYLHETRATTDEYGRHEMSAAAHHELIGSLRKLKGKVMLSGYPSDLYEAHLSSWNRHDFDLPNNAAGGTSKRRMIECVWTNY